MPEGKKCHLFLFLFAALNRMLGDLQLLNFAKIYFFNEMMISKQILVITSPLKWKFRVDYQELFAFSFWDIAQV